MTTAQLLTAVRSAKTQMALADTLTKNQALLAMAQALEEHTEEILTANALDLEQARETVSPVMLDRLALNAARIGDMAEGIRQVAALPNPVGEILSTNTLPNGLTVRKTSVPMGVIAIIYESRPNVTSDAAALALKAGSACILRSGKEAHRSASAIVKALQQGIRTAGLPENCLGLVEDTSRDSAKELMEARGYVDLLIPRGGAGLIKACVEQAQVPVIQTGTGICHTYVDKDADLSMALEILENAKCSRPSVCNACEVCLVHKAIAEKFLPILKERLSQVELRLDPEAAAIIPGKSAGERDFDTEFLDYILAVKVVGSAEEAISHISAHSTGHSECIVTDCGETARLFTASVDASAVYWNASTRFTDGGQFGLGCEMGISTQKLHARGPMGLQELCTYKYIVCGCGQTR